MICVYNSISRFAVPCFIMLSGAFILDNKKNAEYKSFYTKSFAKIGVPTIVFSLLYILYRIPVGLIDKDKGITLLKDILSGAPMYHMWYLYMLIGIYALAPVVIRFKESITEKMFYRVSFVFLILAGISWWTSKVQLNWDIGRSFEYLGYFMSGYCIRKIFSGKSNNRKAFTFILAGIFIEICAAGVEYKRIMNGIPKADVKYSIVGPYSPFIVPASILIFLGFTLLKVNRNYADISKSTFYIYLIHAGIWHFIYNIFKVVLGRNIFRRINGGIWVPVLVISVFFASYVLSKLYLWIWDKLDKEKRITNYLLEMVRLRA